ncbi:MAG: hypothetical protein QM768_22855 [Agriterribacter sp.]
MKYLLLFFTSCISFASCLKQSIPDAMLAAKRDGVAAESTATLSYEIKGIPVQISVPNAGSQNSLYATLSCVKFPGFYALSGISNTGDISFRFYTDSLTLGDYTYNGSYGEEFFISYNGESEYSIVATDYLTFSVTSYENGRISGTFSGQLTPVISDGNNGFANGEYNSTKITKGIFKNVPVFY